MIINTAKATEAAGILGVELETLSPDALSRAYRSMARIHHPDSAEHYNAQAWARVSWAREVLTRWLQRAPAATPAVAAKHGCRSCGGVGRVAVSKPRGFDAKSVTVMCVMCNGSGLQPEGGASAHTGG